MALAESLDRAAPVPALPAKPPNFRAERKLFREGFLRVAGVDEAGRGPLAGPVVAAAVVLNPKRIPKGIADSKILTADAREEIFAALCRTAEISFAFSSVTAIDRFNILQATLIAMRRAVRGLSAPVDAVLIDGNVVPQKMPCEARPMVDGDAKCLSIAAASIVAKVIRDRLMTRCDSAFNGYGLASHKGYSTRQHQEALVELGPCRLHRRSFWRVAAFFEPVQEELILVSEN
jgi:ribonuclease HII